MNTIRCGIGVCCLVAWLAPASLAQQRDEPRENGGPNRGARQDEQFERGYAAGYAAALRRARQMSRSTADRPGYVGEYTPYNPYAMRNRPRASLPSSVAAKSPRTEVRGRWQLDDYVDYPGVADYHRRVNEDVPSRGRRYDRGDFRPDQGGSIYGSRGVLMWTDRYDAGDYANAFWNTHRNNVYAGQRVWDTYNGDQ